MRNVELVLTSAVLIITHTRPVVLASIHIFFGFCLRILSCYTYLSRGFDKHPIFGFRVDMLGVFLFAVSRGYKNFVVKTFSFFFPDLVVSI